MNDKENKIIYISEYNDEYTKEDILDDIRIWIEEIKEFKKIEDRETLKLATYKKLLPLLNWCSPYAKLCDFDEIDINDILEAFEKQKIYKEFLQNVRDESLYFDEEDFNCFLSNLHQEGKITDKQYNELTFEEVEQYNSL